MRVKLRFHFGFQSRWLRHRVGHASLRSRSPQLRRCKHWSEWFGEPGFWARLIEAKGDIFGFIQTIVHAGTILVGIEGSGGD